ncbi:MAG: TlpA disulfide reductase family protein [Candidatus Nanopelagicales bacterium]
MATRRAGTVRSFAFVVLSCVAIAGCGTQDGSNPAGSALPSTSTSVATGSTEGASAAEIDAARLDPCPTSNPDVEPVASGLPDVTLPCLGRGSPVRLSGLRGSPLVVNVWASWCGPCKAELPMMGEYYRANRDYVSFLGIDVGDYRVPALALAASTQMTFPSVQDSSQETRAELRYIGVPTTLFVRPDGTIAGRAGEITSRDELAALVEKYLGVKTT